MYLLTRRLTLLCLDQLGTASTGTMMTAAAGAPVEDHTINIQVLCKLLLRYVLTHPHAHIYLFSTLKRCRRAASCSGGMHPRGLHCQYNGE